MIGIVNAASPDDDGTSNVNTDCTIYITTTNNTFPVPASRLLKELRIVSIIFPSLAITMIPLQNPIRIAAKAISFTPATNSSAISVSPRPPIIPIRRPIPRNTIDNSFMYQPNFTRPVIINAIPATKTTSTNF